MLPELIAAMEQEIPGFRIRFKERSRLQRLLGRLLQPLNPDYLRGYITVLGRTVWWPSQAALRADPQRSAATLLHERVHLWDWRDHPIWFPLSYALVWPAFRTQRAHWERRGYCVDLVILSRRGRTPEQLKAWMLTVFTSSAYGWMWTDRPAVEEWVDRVLAQGLSAELDGELLESTQRWVDRLLEPGV